MTKRSHQAAMLDLFGKLLDVHWDPIRYWHCANIHWNQFHNSWETLVHTYIQTFVQIWLKRLIGRPYWIWSENYLTCIGTLLGTGNVPTFIEINSMKAEKPLSTYLSNIELNIISGRPYWIRSENYSMCIRTLFGPGIVPTFIEIHWMVAEKPLSTHIC